MNDEGKKYPSDNQIWMTIAVMAIVVVGIVTWKMGIW